MVISIIVLAIEEDYRDFSKYWGILWLLFIFVFPLILKVLSVKPLAILIGIVAVGFANEAPAKRPRKPFTDIVEYR